MLQDVVSAAGAFTLSSILARHWIQHPRNLSQRELQSPTTLSSIDESFGGSWTPRHHDIDHSVKGKCDSSFFLLLFSHLSMNISIWLFSNHLSTDRSMISRRLFPRFFHRVCLNEQSVRFAARRHSISLFRFFSIFFLPTRRTAKFHRVRNSFNHYPVKYGNLYAIQSRWNYRHLSALRKLVKKARKHF